MPEQSMRKTRIGSVVSDKMDKTAVVRVDRRIKHRLYKKTMVRSKNYHVHDENNECHPGDVVKIMETRPISCTKCWRLVEVIEKAK